MSISPRTNPGHGSKPPRYPGTFLLAFREALAKLKWEIRRWLGDAVECVDAEGHEQVVGLENLYRRARQSQRGDWPALIVDFLQQAAAPEQPQERPADLASIADQLLVRLGPPFTRKAGDNALWAQPVAGTDFVINLVADYPSRMIYIDDQLIADSGKAGSEWLERALANLRARTPAGSLQTIDADTGMMTCTVADAYDSSRALLLDTLVPTGAADGFFVGLPSRDQLLVLPVTGPALSFIHILKVLVDKSFKNLPYPISNQVFWVRGGVWCRFPIDIKGNRVTIAPPDEFNEVLERLGPPPEADDDADSGEPAA
jgi:hypothetical protein